MNNKHIYFELIFDNENDVAMCGIGTRVPTVEEANDFYSEDLKLMGYEKFEAVQEISKEDALRFYEFDSERTYPIFGGSRATVFGK